MSVQSLLSYALTVPDLAAGRKFYATFGLLPAERDDALAFRCDGRDQDQVLLVEGAKKRLNHLRFGSDETGLAAIRARMTARGLPEIDAPHNAFGGGLWLEDPDGHAINVRAEAARPWRTAAPFLLNNPGHTPRAGRGAPARHQVRPVRLGHVLLHTPDLDRMTRFYTEVLGLQAFRQRAGPHRLHASAAGRRPSRGGAARQRPARLPSRQLRGRQPGRDRPRRAERARGRLWQWLGLRAPRAGLEFLPLSARSVDELGRVFLRHRPDPAPTARGAPETHPAEDALYRWGPPVPPDFDRNFEPE